MTYEQIKKNFDRKLWNSLMVVKAVEHHVISAQQFYDITSDKIVLKTLVVSNNITAAQYQTITGETYVA